MEDVKDIYELSPMQHGLLFDSVTAGDSGMYLIQLEYFLAGELSVPHLEAAWRATLARHAILRTSFHWEGMPKPLQVVHEEVELEIPLEDWTALSAAERDERAAAYLEDDRRRGVDFEEAPLMRLALFRETNRDFRLIWSFHHILMEGWSASLVLAEVRIRYRALTSGGSPSLVEHRPYRDFVAWSQEQDPAAGEAFWRGELAGFESPSHSGIDLAPSGTHAPVRDFDERKVTLDAAASKALTSFGQAQGLTLNTLIQGAWALVVSRYASEEDVVFGTMVSGRSIALDGVESIIGLFVNLLPTRVAVRGSEPLVEWLKALQDRQVRQREFEYLSLADVKRWSEMPAGLPLFESLLVFENWSGDLTVADWGAGLEVRDVRGHHGSPGHPIMVTVVPGPRIGLSITYDEQRFEAAAVDRMLANFMLLLEAIPVDAERRLDALPSVSAAELVLLDSFNAAAATTPSDAWVTQQVDERIRDSAQRVALRFGGQALTYSELGARIDAAAARLRSTGVRPGSIVALCVDRSPDMVAMLLAVLRLGAAYVPLDPAYPAARIGYILGDCGASVLVTERAFAEDPALSEVLSACDARVLLLDGGQADETGTGASSERARISGEELAYVIYTSGSTGNPKGVEVTHRSLANFLDSMRREPGLSADDVLVAVTTLAFDIAGLELYLPLTTGAELVLASRSEAADGEALTALMDENGATVCQATPATWRMLLQIRWPGRSELKVLCGGEALPPELARDLRPLCKELWNVYGPTETTIWSASARVEADERVTVGHPIANTEVYILDSALERVPLGVTGELFIGGAGLARGYRNRAALTAEKFIPDRFSGRPGNRIYATGDLARFRSDGALEILGRIDNQVKLRGFRIELGEIEATLEKRADVIEAVCLARDDGRLGKRLVAYLVGKDTAPLDIGELRSSLRETLPEYMVPAIFVPLDELPRTPNGKLDRRALPAPDAVRPEIAEGFEAPRTPLEEKLAEIWRSVLEIDRVGVRDNFFDLGGHSLLLMPVISELKEQFGVRVDPGELVLPTLAQLATLCEERMARPEEDAAPAGLMRRLLGKVRGSASADEQAGGA